MTFSTFVILCNFAGAICAFVANLWGARRVPTNHRWVYASTAALSALYMVAYVWLLQDVNGRVTEWSNVMRGVSIVVWPVVWILPPLVEMHMLRRRAQHLEQLAERLSEDKFPPKVDG